MDGLKRWLVVGIAIMACAAWTSDAAAQIYALPRPDTTGMQSFGVSVAVSGNVAVVGSSGEDVCGENSGAAYVYERTEEGGPWSRVARLTPSECRANAFFGESVDASGDRVIVSASSEFFAFEESNAAYVFSRDTSGTWQETVRLTGIVGENEGVFAAGVALDGNRAAVTTTGSLDGDFGGAVYVFDYDANADRWRRTARLTASQGVRRGVLGGNVALDGNRLAVAASTYFERKPGSVYLFDRDAETGTWRESTVISRVEDFFIALSLHEETLLVGESRGGRKASGMATVYAETTPGRWERQTTLRPSTPYESGAFGSAVSMHDGWALVTGYDEQLGQDFNIDRVVYAFKRADDGTWRQRTIIDIGEVAFGASIDQDGTTAIISSVPENAPGAAYVVQLH